MNASHTELESERNVWHDDNTMVLDSLEYSRPLLGSFLHRLAYWCHLQLLSGTDSSKTLRSTVSLDCWHRRVCYRQMALPTALLGAAKLSYALDQGAWLHLLAACYRLYCMGALGAGQDVVKFSPRASWSPAPHRWPLPDQQAPDLYRHAGHALWHDAHEWLGLL